MPWETGVLPGVTTVPHQAQTTSGRFASVIRGQSTSHGGVPGAGSGSAGQKS